LLDANIEGKKSQPSDSRKHYGLAKVIDMDFVEAEREKERRAQQLEQAEKDRKRQEKEEKALARTQLEALKKISRTTKKEALQLKKDQQLAERESKKRKREMDLQDLITGTTLARAIQEYPADHPALKRARAATARARKRQQGQSQGQSQGLFTREGSVMSIASDLIDPALVNWPHAAASQSEYPDLR
jgi:hypothetical protein